MIIGLAKAPRRVVDMYVMPGRCCDGKCEVHCVTN